MRQVCGLDVHKDSVFVCILNENGIVFQEKFGVLTPELEQMLSVMLQYRVEEVCMESTSIYWMPVWIATCLLKDLIKGSYVPEDLIQQLRQYDRRISDLNAEIVRKLGKLDAALQRCNIRISNYVSSTDGKSYKEVVRLISEGIRDPSELTKVIHGRTVNRVGRDVVLASLTGVISDTDIDVMRQL